jgi:DNA repair photolyase
VAPVFEQRLRSELPLRADRVMARIREARGGKLYDSRWGMRQVGEGNYAEMVQALFTSTVRRLGMNNDCYGRPGPDTFQRPGRGKQLPLL